MSVFDAVLLALLQVLTEFLPVSSSGHLVLGQLLLGIDEGNLAFTVLVHLGTLLATVLYFSRELIGLFASVKKELDEEVFGPASRLLLILLVANLPAGLVGIFFKDQIEQHFNSAGTASLMFLLTAFFLFLTQYASGEEGYGLYEIPMSYGLLIGVAQAVAIVPGISRSGLTISIAMFLMIRREEAGRFSFLLSIPALSGAALLKFGDVEGLMTLIQFPYLVGLVVSTLGGLLALKLLFIVVRKERFHVFSYYLCGIGLFGVVYLGVTGIG